VTGWRQGQPGRGIRSGAGPASALGVGLALGGLTACAAGLAACTPGLATSAPGLATSAPGLATSAPGLATSAPGPPLAKLDPPARESRLAGDAAAVQIYRAGLRDVVAYVEARPDLFARDPARAPALPSREAREAIWAAWQRFLDYTLALDAVGRAHQRFAELAPPDRERSFAIGHAAYVAQYRFALDLLARLDRNPALLPQLDEPVPELGLPAGTYTRARVRFLNVVRGTEFAALGLVDEDARAAAPPGMAAAIAEDRAAIWRYGAGRGEILTARSALQVVQRAAFAGWFPVQAGIAEWMGDTRLVPPGRALVTSTQVAALAPALAPGDILLVRREWYLSNIGIPGFWPHAVLYVGTPEERRRAFAGPEVAAWVEARGQVNGDFEALLARTHPAAHARALRPDGSAPRRTLEALSDGVVFTTLEHAAGADHVAALRPRLPAVEKAGAILRAFGYAGRPYDFNFDFRTDAALVCSEVIYKAYEPGPGRQGLRLPLVHVLGRPVLPPSTVARLFDTELGTPAAQLDLVRFLDGQAAAGVAVEASVEVFRRSWRRPKWPTVAAEPAQAEPE
jgi:Permuted papain-like amidase enzyme, YaeF/YiiX, C92 family